MSNLNQRGHFIIIYTFFVCVFSPIFPILFFQTIFVFIAVLALVSAEALPSHESIAADFSADKFSPQEPAGVLKLFKKFLG